MRNDVYIRNFKRLIEIGIINDKGELQFQEAIKLKSKPFMDLNIDHLSHKDGNDFTVIAIAHNYIQNGDVMAEPDMEIKIIPEMQSVEALTYQLDSMGIFQQVYSENYTKVNPRLKKELNSFLEKWLINIKAQKFKMPFICEFMPNKEALKIGDKIYVGGLGEAIVSQEGIEVHHVIDDNVKSWQLQIARGDNLIESVRVMPIKEN